MSPQQRHAITERHDHSARHLLQTSVHAIRLLSAIKDIGALHSRLFLLQRSSAPRRDRQCPSDCRMVESAILDSRCVPLHALSQKRRFVHPAKAAASAGISADRRPSALTPERGGSTLGRPIRRRTDCLCRRVARFGSRLRDYNKAETNEETASQIPHPSPSEASRTMINRCPRVSRCWVASSNGPGRNIRPR